MKNPKLIVKPFAKNGQKNVIPENYETSMESNQATWDQGFGQITMLPVAAGGLPPKGQDFNGIFNQISENIVYLSQGGRFKFSAEYAEAIGGYPKGAILQSDDEKKEYLSLIDNNKVNFNTTVSISASWKLVNTDDLLAQIASKQPKGDYATKTELNSGLAGKQPTGDYATKTELGLKIDKTAVVQATGTSTANVMSQKAVTDLANTKQQKGNYADGDAFKRTSANASISPPGGVNSLVLRNDGLLHIWDGEKSVFSISNTGEIITGEMAYSRLTSVPVVQSTGSSTTSFMSQNAATKAFALSEFFSALSGESRMYSGDKKSYFVVNDKQNVGLYNPAAGKYIWGFNAEGVMTSGIVPSLGIQQSWRDLTSDRRANTEYTNTTGKPIFVSVSKDSAMSTYGELIVDGVIVGRLSAGDFSVTAYAVVPDGSKYKCTSGNIINWSELR